MTKEKYMALADLQTVWDNTLKPWIQQQITPQTYASVETCKSIISELT